MELKKKKLVSIIIVSWNQKEYTLGCLESVLKNNYRPVEIILVDNGSTDGTVDIIKKKFPRVKIIENRKNLGFAKANNQGFKKSKGKYILLLNNDTKIIPTTISVLVRALEEDRQVGVAQAKLYWMAEPDKNDLVGTYLTPVGFVYYFGYGKKDEPKYLKKRTIFFAKGASMIVRREIIEKIGFFDEDFITYFEEYDFCWRVWLAGFKVVYIPDAIVYHRLNVTGSMLPKPYTLYLTSRNRLTTLIKNLSAKNLIWILSLHIPVLVLVAIFYLFRNPRLSASFISALLWNVKVLPSTLKKRFFVQKYIRRVGDAQVLKENLVWPPLSYYLYLTKDMRFYKDIKI